MLCNLFQASLLRWVDWRLHVLQERAACFLLTIDMDFETVVGADKQASRSVMKSCTGITGSMPGRGAIRRRRHTVQVIACTAVMLIMLPARSRTNESGGPSEHQEVSANVFPPIFHSQGSLDLGTKWHKHVRFTCLRSSANARLQPSSRAVSIRSST